MAKIAFLKGGLKREATFFLGPRPLVLTSRSPHNRALRSKGEKQDRPRDTAEFLLLRTPYGHSFKIMQVWLSRAAALRILACLDKQVNNHAAPLSNVLSPVDHITWPMSLAPAHDAAQHRKNKIKSRILTGQIPSLPHLGIPCQIFGPSRPPSIPRQRQQHVALIQCRLGDPSPLILPATAFVFPWSFH